MLPWRQWPSQLTEKTQVETGKRTWLDCQNLVGVGIGIWTCLHSLYSIVQFSMYTVYIYRQIYIYIYIYLQYRYEASIQNVLLFTVLLTECFPFSRVPQAMLVMSIRGSTPSRGRQHWGGTQMNAMPQYVVYIYILWYIINNGFHWIKLLGSSLLQEIFWTQLCFAIWGYQWNQVREYITIHGLSGSMKDNGT